MKKIAILLVAIIFFCAAGCGKSGSYKYAENYKFTAYDDVASDEFWTDLSVSSTDADIGDLLDLIKKIVQHDFGKLNLDWDNLMNITKVRQVAVGAENLDARYALASTEVGEMYLFPGYFTTSEKNQLQALTHALMLAALSAGPGESSQLDEGLAEYYASILMSNVGYSMEETVYPHQMTAAVWLIAVFGEEKVINAARENKLPELVDSYTKPGMGTKLEEALTAINLGSDQNRAENAVYDILAHTTVGAGKRLEDVDHLIEYLEDLSKLEGTNVDTSYMRKVLQRKA